MESLSIAIANPPHLLQTPPSSPCSSGRKSSATASPSASPEFEFWKVRNPSFPPACLLTADELIVDGMLLPLQRLSLPQPDPPDTDPFPRPDSDAAGPSVFPVPEPRQSGPEITSEPASASKRWRDIFKKSIDKKGPGDTAGNRAAEKDRDKDKDKEKRKEKRGRSGSGSPELNINIWPFSRSRSAGNSRTRPGVPFGAPALRKASSAPCSRSNSSGDSKSRVKWPGSPGRVGVHMGRSSPVWQARRSGASASGGSEPATRSAPKSVKKNKKEKEYCAEIEAKRLNLNVPACIGYRNRLGCRSEANAFARARAGSGGSGGVVTGSGNSAGVGGNLFSLRSLFTKKVH